MLIKANKRKNKNKLLANSEPKNKTLPDQIMSFIGDEVERTSAKDGFMDDKALEAILGKNLSKLDIARQSISQEDIDAQAKKIIEARSQELLKEFEINLAQKKQKSEAEIEQRKEEAAMLAEKVVEEANEHVLSQAKKLDKDRQEFEAEKQSHLAEIQNLKNQALRDAIEEAKPYVTEVVELFKNLNTDRQELAEYIKDNIAAIAFDVAKQVLKHEVKTNPDILQQQVLHSINKLLDSKGVIKIILNPEDEDKHKELQVLLKNVLDTSVRLVFAYDNEVDTGSCSIQTSGGKLDASFSTQLDTIKTSFEQYLGHKISILPDETAFEVEELEDIDEEENFFEDSQVAEDKSSIKTKPSTNLEPSEEELMELEENFEDFADLNIDDDLSALLGEILDEDEDDSAVEFKSSKKEPREIEEHNLIDLNDSDELGANDFSNGDDWDLKEDEEFIEDLSEKSQDKEYKDEDGNTFVEYNEFDGDENFGESDETTDERFPEY